MKLVIILSILASASTSLTALDRGMPTTPAVTQVPTTQEVECAKLFIAANGTGLTWLAHGNTLKLTLVGDAAIRDLFANWNHSLNKSLPPSRYRGYIHHGIAHEIFMDIVAGEILDTGTRTYRMADSNEQNPYSIDVTITASEDGRSLKTATLIVTEH